MGEAEIGRGRWREMEGKGGRTGRERQGERKGRRAREREGEREEGGFNTRIAHPPLPPSRLKQMRSGDTR
jgi:hypothetical protein